MKRHDRRSHRPVIKPSAPARPSPEKKAVSLVSEATVFRLFSVRQGDDDWLFDLVRTKLALALLLQKPQLGRGMLSAAWTLCKLNSVTQNTNDPDAFLVMCVDGKSQQPQLLLNRFSVLRKQALALEENVSAPQAARWGGEHRVRGFAIGTVIEWRQETADGLDSKTSQQAKERAFEVELICSDVERCGIGRCLMTSQEAHVRQRHPDIKRIYASALFHSDAAKPAGKKEGATRSRSPGSREEGKRVEAFYTAMGYRELPPAQRLQQYEQESQTWMFKDLR